MPLNYSRRITGNQRTDSANRHLGFALSFVAGAINAGGFLAVQQYTSHMTGIVSSIADNLARASLPLAAAGLVALLSFAIGATCSTILICFSRQRKMHSEYALPLMFEAVLLLIFGLLGVRLAFVDGMFVSLTVMLLAFIMGLQNAVITKLSNAEIRTTHVTGIVTDIGIQLGKLLYSHVPVPSDSSPVISNVPRLRLLSTLLTLFFAGGMVGAVGFRHLGYAATVPLALILIALASAPVIDDLRIYLRRFG
jgi:uncharacterized membrane protein YoaK (UPF0700 family)